MPQGVERAVAEQTVKILRVVGGVAGEIFARPVTEERIPLALPVRLLGLGLIGHS